MERRTNIPYAMSEAAEIADMVRRYRSHQPAGMPGMDNVRMDAAADGDQRFQDGLVVVVLVIVFIALGVEKFVKDIGIVLRHGRAQFICQL